MSAMAYRATPIPVPDEQAQSVLRDTARMVLSRSEFELDDDPGQRIDIARMIFDFFIEVLRPIIDFFQPLTDLREANPVLGWGITIGLILILFVALVLVFRQTFRLLGVSATVADDDLKDLSRAGRLFTPQSWEERAKTAATQEDYGEAIRCLFKATLMSVTRVMRRPPRRGATNREYLRRLDGTPIKSEVALFVDLIDHKWYRGEDCDATDYHRSQQAYAEIRRFVGRFGQ